MARAAAIMEESGGKITRKHLAAAIGCRYEEAVEYLGLWRSTPNSENTLRILAWIIGNSTQAEAKAFLKTLSATEGAAA